MQMIRMFFVVPVLCLASVTVLNGADAPEAPAKPAYAVPRTWSFGQLGVALKDDLTIEQGGPKDAQGKFVATVGDKLLEWNGQKLATLDDYCRCLYASKPGDEVTLKIARPDADNTKPPLELTVVARLGDPKRTSPTSITPARNAHAVMTGTGTVNAHFVRMACARALPASLMNTGWQAPGTTCWRPTNANLTCGTATSHSPALISCCATLRPVRDTCMK